MKKFAVSFLGRDCPGVVASVAELLENAKCDVYEVSQTILEGDFAAIFVVLVSDDTNADALLQYLNSGLAEKKVDLSVIVRPAILGEWSNGRELEPFVITVDGPDSTGIIATMSRVCANHGVNIESFKAVLGDVARDHAFLVFEVMVPSSADPKRLRRDLVEHGKKHSLNVSMQHRDIFEAVNRIGSV